MRARPAGCRRHRVDRGRFWLAVGAAGLLAAACSRSEPPPRTLAERRTVDPRTGTSASPRLHVNGQRIPKGGGTYKVGVPYQISGRWYTPREEPGYDRTGIGSWYGDDFHGRKTANGEIYDMDALTAAHPTLPMPCYVYVTNELNGRTILVRVNDRGPYAQDRVIDLSRASARALGYQGRGLTRVRVRYAGPAPLNGDDRREQAFLHGQPWSREIGREEVARRPVPRPGVADGARWRPPGAMGLGATPPSKR